MVASAIVTAPERVFAPLEVRNVPVDPEKSFAPDPDAVSPEVTTCVVIAGDVEKTRLVEVVPVAPAAVYPVMLLKAVMPADVAFVPPSATVTGAVMAMLVPVIVIPAPPVKDPCPAT